MTARACASVKSPAGAAEARGEQGGSEDLLKAVFHVSLHFKGLDEAGTVARVHEKSRCRPSRCRSGYSSRRLHR